MRELLELVAGRTGSGAYGDAVHRGRCQCRERFGIGSLAQFALSCASRKRAAKYASSVWNPSATICRISASSTVSAMGR
jgi:hypothetical protein